MSLHHPVYHTHPRDVSHFFLDGYCSTVQGLLDWFEVDLGFPELVLFGLICVFCVFLFFLLPLVPLLSFLDILHCLPRAVGVPLESRDWGPSILSVAWFPRDVSRFSHGNDSWVMSRIWRIVRALQMQSWGAHAFIWVMSPWWMSHVTRMNESYHMYDGLLVHSKCRVKRHTHLVESCRKFGWVMSHIRLSHVAHLVASCRTFGQVMSHIWLSHVAHLVESCRTFGWVMSHIWLSHVANLVESCRTFG